MSLTDAALNPHIQAGSSILAVEGFSQSKVAQIFLRLETNYRLQPSFSALCNCVSDFPLSRTTECPEDVNMAASVFLIHLFKNTG